MTKQIPDTISMSGRRAIVTGAASGIGKATALVLAELGADLVLVDLSPMDATRDEVQAMGARCTVKQGDLTDAAFLASLFSGDRIHAVAHCAGILFRTPWDEDANWGERFQRMMAVNVRVPLEITQAAVNHMGEHGGGNIVLVGSVAGKTGGTSLNTPPDYSASKGAVHAIMKWMSRKAIAKGVLVNAVAPGPVQTPMTRGNNMGPNLPLGRMGKAEELAWPIAFLCTGGAAYMSGAILDVNGGAFVG